MPIKIITKEELDNRYKDFCTVGDLKKFLEENDLPDDGKILVQRIEDVYYEKHGWGVYLKEGYHFYSHTEMNKNMEDEIARRARGDEPQYPKIEDPSKYICSEEDMEKLKEQYHPAWSPVFYKDEKHLFIDLHY